MTVMPPGPGAPAVEATTPTNEQIMEVLGLTHGSTEQLCQRMRDLFAGAQQHHKFDWLDALDLWAKGPDDALLDFQGVSVPGKMQDLLDAAFSRPATIEDIQEEIYEINVANGWYEDERPFGDDIALLHSEVTEMYEAYRDWLFEDKTPACNCPVTTSGVRGLHHNTECAMFGKPEGVGSEAADVLIRLDTCRRHDIDIRFETVRKLRFNRKRGYKHGGKHV